MMKEVLAIILFCTFSQPPCRGQMRVVGNPERIAGEDGHHFMRPVWSPDGSKIALTQSNHRGLWIVDPDGDNLRRISDEPSAGYGFEWSSDSGALLTRVAKFEGRYRYNAVKIFDLVSGSEERITPYMTFMPGLPHWTDGDRSIFYFQRGELKIIPSKRVTDPLRKADGVEPGESDQTIVFLHQGKIAVGNSATEKYEVFEPLEGSRTINVVLSPDKRRIAFEVVGGNCFVMGTDGRDLVDLGRMHRPQWDPSSRYLVSMVTTDDGYRYVTSDLYCVRMDGSERIRLTKTSDILEMNPNWSPDGGAIVYDRLKTGGIYILRVTM
jgi:Tol biopolymer transport system component